MNFATLLRYVKLENNDVWDHRYYALNTYYIFAEKYPKKPCFSACLPYFGRFWFHMKHSLKLQLFHVKHIFLSGFLSHFTPSFSPFWSAFCLCCAIPPFSLWFLVDFVTPYPLISAPFSSTEQLTTLKLSIWLEKRFIQTSHKQVCDITNFLTPQTNLLQFKQFYP